MSKLFKALNHPQQVKARGGPLPGVDDRSTSLELFAELNREFRFTLDVAASKHNAKCKRFFTEAENGLRQPWDGRAWCNPPYSDILPWVEKALEETVGLHFGRCPLAVLLLPASRCEQPWWQDLIEPIRDRRGTSCTTRFIRGRRQFGNLEGEKVVYKSSPPFGLVAVIFRGVK